jgi:hypothetical protein
MALLRVGPESSIGACERSRRASQDRGGPRRHPRSVTRNRGARPDWRWFEKERMRGASPGGFGRSVVSTFGNACAALPIADRAYAARRGGVVEHRAMRRLCSSGRIARKRRSELRTDVYWAASRLLRAPRHRVTVRLPPPRPLPTRLTVSSPGGALRGTRRLWGAVSATSKRYLS